MLKDMWQAVRGVFESGIADAPAARFWFRHQVNAQTGDFSLSVLDHAYRVTEKGLDARGTLTPDELDAFVRDVDAHVWALDATPDTNAPQATCQPWTTVDVRLGARRHHVRYYGWPNPRIERFEAFLGGSIVKRHAYKLEASETFDPALMCLGCSSKHAAGATTCRHDGNGLIRLQPSGLFRCASCDGKLPMMLYYVTACPGCGAAMPVKKT